MSIKDGFEGELDGAEVERTRASSRKEGRTGELDRATRNAGQLLNLLLSIVELYPSQHSVRG